VPLFFSFSFLFFFLLLFFFSHISSRGVKDPSPSLPPHRAA
jgi:hypothetical protein